MPNMELKKSPMPVQDAYARICNFDEVALGYTYETAVNEAKRCLNCKHKPCVSGCPVEIDIPAFLAKVAAEDMEGAYEVLSRSTSLPAVCGRVCPQESQCEGKCVRGIKGDPVGIGRLERFVADWHREHGEQAVKKPRPNGLHRVPSGNGRTAGEKRRGGARQRRADHLPDTVQPGGDSGRRSWQGRRNPVRRDGAGRAGRERTAASGGEEGQRV